MARTVAGTRFLDRNFGTALNFLGAGTLVKTSAVGLVNSNVAQSLAIWCKQPRKAAGNESVFTVLNAGVTSSIGINFTSTGNIQIGNHTGGTLVSSNFIPTFQTWHRVVVTYDATTWTIYIDGVSRNTATTVADTGTPTILRVSTYDGSNQACNAKIDDVCYWSRLLTSAEVAADYFQGIVPTNSLQLRWLLDEGSGTSATDSSGNSNTGTISTATYTTDVVSLARSASTVRTLAGTRVVA